jgi:hypothetical protein
MSAIVQGLARVNGFSASRHFDSAFNIPLDIFEPAISAWRRGKMPHGAMSIFTALAS